MEGGGKGKKRKGRDLPDDDISLVWWLCKHSGPIRIRCSKISKKIIHVASSSMNYGLFKHETRISALCC